METKNWITLAAVIFPLFLAGALAFAIARFLALGGHVRRERAAWVAALLVPVFAQTCFYLVAGPRLRDWTSLQTGAGLTWVFDFLPASLILALVTKVFVDHYLQTKPLH